MWKPCGDPTGTQKGIISKAASSPPCSRVEPFSKYLFFSSNIPQLDGAGSFSSEKELYIQSSTPTVVPLVQHECQCSQSTPLVTDTTDASNLIPTHVQPLSNKPVSTTPLSQTPTKQRQPTQILASLQPISVLPLSTLPEQDKPEPEQQEPEPDQHETEQDQHEPEQDQHEPEPEL